MNTNIRMGGGKSDRDSSIDLLKSVAILMVIVTHFGFHEDFCMKWLFPFHIDMAVPIFMVITGYNFYISCAKHSGNIFRQWFSRTSILNKTKRIVIPFAILFLLELVIEILVRHNNVAETIKEMFVLSGYGPGGYYFYVIIQIIIIFPLLFFCFQKKPLLTLCCVLLVSIVFEVFVMQTELWSRLYRIIAIRYLTAVILGMVIAKYGRKIKWPVAVASLLVGGSFIYVLNYTPYQLIFTQWIGTAFPTAFYAAFFVFVTINYIKIRNIMPIHLIGKATYHIFLVQMFYYYYLVVYINRSIGWGITSLIIAIIGCTLVGVTLSILSPARIKPG